MRPQPCTMLGWVVDMATAVLAKISFTSCRVKLPFADKIRAIVPTTCGVAIDVPLLYPYALLGNAE